MAWLTTNAVRLRTPTLCLGPSFASFATSLGLFPTSTSLPPLREQLGRLMETTVSCLWDNTQSDDPFKAKASPGGWRLAYKYKLWWQDPPPEDEPSFVQLSADFFQELIASPVPLDMNVLRALRSPFAMDLYSWLTWRSIRTLKLQRPELVSWEALQSMFGADYHDLFTFRFHFKKSLKKVVDYYPALRVTPTSAGLKLLTYPPHVPVRTVR